MIKNLKRSTLVEYLFQLVILILGVFLGILATEWSTEKNQKKFERDIMTGMRNELQVNLDYLESVQPRRLAFQKSLDSLSAALSQNDEVKKEVFYDQPFSKRIPNWPGFGKNVMDKSMFEVAKSGNILPNLKVELLQQLSKTYSFQNSIEDYGGTLRAEYFDIDSNTKYFEVINMMWIFMQEYFGSHYLLMEDYKKSIALIDKYYPPN
ncbi:hypothetical protein GTQ40_06225 [Flavobacteriaceae bacterium R38]|nr:hypothetical protein [Flavobacteriaceae bacterium R38]